MSIWVIPYVDEPPSFWEELAERFGPHIKEVYFPMPDGITGSGRSNQPDKHINLFLQNAPLSKSVLVNPIVLQQPLEEIGSKILAALEQLHGDFGVGSVVVANLALARLIREKLPVFRITASVLMQISTPAQAVMIGDYVDTIVPDSHLVRDLPGLQRLRQAFPGEVRLIVNECCLPNCPFRTQHFYEMGYSDFFPLSLCQQTLEEKPWLRLTGAWILPRHLHYYDNLYDSLKLAGRVTLQNPDKYFKVLDAYINRKDILPVDVGGGPASVLEPIDVPDDLFQYMINCSKDCHDCSVCRDYYEQAIKESTNVKRKPS